MCHVDLAKGNADNREDIISGHVWWGVFPEGISIWTGKQSREDLSISKLIISYCVPKPILDEYFTQRWVQ